jgi:DNA-binding MarR family transcriptional regulator
MQDGTNHFVELCEARLRLVKREKRLLKLHHQIPLEILLTLAAADGHLKINDLYERVDATDAAVRMHLRGMEQEGLIESQRSDDDRRVKYLHLTQSAKDLLLDCLRTMVESLPAERSGGLAEPSLS